MSLLLIVVGLPIGLALGLVLGAWLLLRSAPRASQKEKRKTKELLSIAFIHPDLGMGGAEKLVVETAVLIKNQGHEVKIFTSHHDKSRCFDVTKDGTLEVAVAGDWFPREIFGRFQLPCAIFRFIFTSAALLRAHQKKPFDVIFVDQISATIPMLRWSGIPILFYCHFPDQLLTLRTSIFKSFYRLPLDLLEEITTAYSDRILVNSKFTAQVFAKTFTRIRQQPKVLYPCVDPSQYAFGPGASPTTPRRRNNGTAGGGANGEEKKEIVLLSLNRFERKKNIMLAIDTLRAVLKKLSHASGYDSASSSDDDLTSSIMLYIAGGYDTRVKENVDHMNELVKRAVDAGVAKKVRFLPSINDQRRNELLNECYCLLYTPSNEHFGIVPLEAALAGKPVIACSSGGPLETVVDGKTGFLREPEPEQWADAIVQLISDKNLRDKMGKNALEHVKTNFSVQQFTSQLESTLYELVNA